MITAEQKKKLKSVLKNGYPKEVQKNLNKKKLLNQRGNPYRIGFILDVMNGIFENYQVEETIIKLYQIKVEETRLIHERRNNILGLSQTKTIVKK